MTRIPVTDVGQLMPYTADTVNKVQSGGSGFGESFKAAMNNRYNNTNDDSYASGMPKKENTDASLSTEKRNSVDKDNFKQQRAEKPKASEEKVTYGDEKISEETAEEIASQVVQVIEKVAEVMDTGTEEVVLAVESLGMEMTDLLDPTKMTDIITLLSGAEDSISLVMDEELYSKLGELQEFVSASEENLMNELDLSQEALNEILNRSEEQVETKTLFEFGMLRDESLQEPEVSIEGMKDYKVTEFVDGKVITTDVTVDDVTGAQTANVSIATESDEEEKGNPSNENHDGDKHSDAENNHVQFFSQEIQKNNEIDMPVETNFTESFISRESEASRIANQIMENMRINLKSDMTTLEMNLHPASLGNVRVNLTAQNGQITAQFIAQNETVRAAIESQVVQLTNQLEDQGIKVESVEVAVADHKFEHEGGDDPGQNGSNNESGKPKAGRIRKIDLSTLDEDTDFEDLEESDRIAAEMMAQEGNKVDYTA